MQDGTEMIDKGFVYGMICLLSSGPDMADHWPSLVRVT